MRSAPARRTLLRLQDPEERAERPRATKQSCEACTEIGWAQRLRSWARVQRIMLRRHEIRRFRPLIVLRMQQGNKTWRLMQLTTVPRPRLFGTAQVWCHATEQAPR